MARGNKRKNGTLAFIFLLPLLLMVLYLVLNTSKSLSLKNVNKITVVSPNAGTTVIDSATDIEFYLNVMNGAQHTDSSIREVDGESPMIITCHQEGKTSEYKLYPTLNATGCILVDPDKELYVLESNDAKQLLLRNEFAYLYSNYFLPTMKVISGDSETVVLPIDSVWNYYKSDDVLYEYSPEYYGSGNETYVILKGFDNQITFTPGNEVLPYTVTEASYITASGNEYNIDSISQLDLSVDTVISVNMKVEWSNKNSARAFGSAEYKFNLLYDLPATLGADIKDNYTAGQIIKVFAQNLNAGEETSIATLLDMNGIGFDKIDEDTSIAFLPIGLNRLTADEEKTYSLLINSAADSISKDITVKAPDGGIWTPINATTEEYTACLSPDKIAEFRQAMAEATAKRPEIEEPYFKYSESSPMFKHPVSGNHKFGFGKKVNLGVPGSEGGVGAHTCEGFVYELEEGTKVRAAQKGEIVFCGNLATTGNTVVIYHGYGIYSYYFHLEEYDDIRVGTIVNDGRVIGTAGKTGFTAGKTVLNFAVSIDGVFVDPQYFFE